MASPSELNLDCKPHSYSMLLKSFGGDQTHKLEEFLSSLEEERLKIDAFKRELPLCMQLLTNAVEASRQQLQASRGNQGGSRPTLEEFIPIKHVNKASSISSDMATWLTTAQLWSQAGNNETKMDNTTNVPLTKESDVIGFNVRNRGGGAFLPFSKEKNNPSPSPTTLALSTVDMEDKKCSEGTRENGVKRDQEPSWLEIDRQGHEAANISPADGQAGNIVNSNTSTNNSNGGNGQRKARRCWSPDLHRRFVNALQMLGGSQVATPKQIRELMKVDGLTNDEVKSHLQKYRLHTRRPSPSPQVPGAPTPQLVVLGSIWVPPEYAGGVPTLYGAHHHPATSHPVPPPHLCSPTPPVTQEFYTVAVPPHRIYESAMQSDHHLSSPESDNRGSGDRSESIEDRKSDQSGSWKVESGERRGLATLREDGEESNGTEITLKF